MSFYRSFLGAVLMLVATCAWATPDTHSPGEGLMLICTQPEQASLRCDYRIASSAEVLGSSARIGDLTLPAPQFAARGPNSEPAAVLLLVEAAMLANATRREQVVGHVQRIISAASPHLRFGLARFGDTLEVVAPIGSAHGTLIERLAEPPPASERALLYRNVAHATELLTASSAERRVVLLLATGRSDDKLLNHTEAVRGARGRGTLLFSIAYPGASDAGDDEGSDRLRKLSLDTGGLFVVSDAQAALPESYFDAPFAALDNAGALSVDLGPALTGLSGGEYLVRVSLDTASGTVHGDVPVLLTGAAFSPSGGQPIDVNPSRPAGTAATGALPPGATRLAPATRAQQPIMFWILIAAAAVLILILLLLLGLLLLRRRAARRVSRPQTHLPRLHGTSIPYLVSVDGDMRSHRIGGERYKIGRLGNNDLVLRDPSVSRHHAELTALGDNTFRITDLESMNGVYVNGRRVRERMLSDGDELEIGDVRLNFELRFDDPLEREATREFVPDDAPSSGFNRRPEQDLQSGLTRS